jgi:hypothetical protein
MFDLKSGTSASRFIPPQLVGRNIVKATISAIQDKPRRMDKPVLAAKNRGLGNSVDTSEAVESSGQPSTEALSPRGEPLGRVFERDLDMAVISNALGDVKHSFKSPEADVCPRSWTSEGEMPVEITTNGISELCGIVVETVIGTEQISVTTQFG